MNAFNICFYAQHLLIMNGVTQKWGEKKKSINFYALHTFALNSCKAKIHSTAGLGE